MSISRFSGACEIWVLECYKYPAPLALRSIKLGLQQTIKLHILP